MHSDKLLDCKELFDKYVGKNANSLSAFSFVNIYAWKDFFYFDFKVIDDALCVFAQNEIGCFLYLPPLGSCSNKIICECFAHMEAINKGSGVSRVENVPDSYLFFFENEFKVFKKYYEYCYYRSDIVSLGGNAFKSQRNAYNSFVSQQKPVFLPFSKQYIKGCLELYDAWSANKKDGCQDDIALAMLEENRFVHKVLMERCEDLGLIGRVAIVDGQVKAYTFGYVINDNVFCVLCEIADIKCKGAAVFIFREFCSDDKLKPFKFINVMDDFHLPSLKSTKMSFHPTSMMASYVVSKRNN